MAKKKKDFFSSGSDAPSDNPFASLLGGLDLPPAPEGASDKVWEDEATDGEASMEPKQQKLYVSIDRKQRKGKEVTLVEGFQGSEAALQTLAKKLKTACGVGGSAKEGNIIVQGNQRDKIIQLLLEAGYQQTKRKGG